MIQPETKLEASTLGTLLTVYSSDYNGLRSRLFSLLTLVPSITFGSVALAIFQAPNSSALLNLTFPLGIGGVIVVTGLFFIAVTGMRDSAEKLAQIHQVESELGRKSVPRKEHPIINVRNAIGLLFAFAAGGWVCLAFWFLTPGLGPWFALIVIVASFISSFPIVHTNIAHTN